MSASRTPTFAPPNALRVWADSRYLYAELPRKPGGEPCILSYSRTTRGFADLIALLYGSADHAGAPLTPSTPRKQFIGTPTQHALAEAILREKGILK